MELKAMSLGGILDAAFRLYRENFLSFLMVGLILFVPYSLMVCGIVAYSGLPPNYEDGFTSPAGFVGTALYYFLVQPLSGGAMICLISATYLGRRMSAGEAYLQALQRIGTLVFADFLYGLLLIVGLILLIVPGVLFSIWFMLAPAVVVLEERSARRSLGRSRSLLKDNFSKGFLLMLLVTFLSMIVVFGVGIVPYTLGFLLEVDGVYFDVFMESFFEAILLPLSTGVVVLFYYDLLIRKEAFDLERLAANLETAPQDV